MNDEKTDFGFDATDADAKDPIALEEGTPKKGKSSLLDQLREVVEKEVRRPSIEIEVPDREGVTVVFSPNINQEQMSRWRINAGERRKDGLNFLKLSTIILGQTCEEIRFDGEAVEDEDGYKLTFASEIILDMVNETDPIPHGIKRFWGNDAHLQASALKVLEAAGWGDEAEANPTME